jgi:hypothetical protein
MNISQAPDIFLHPWAYGAGAEKNAIPADSQALVDPGLASLYDGFPSATMTDVNAGGVPPYGQDMNGILYWLSAAMRYLQAGGNYKFSSALVSAITGYPAGASIIRGDGLGAWINTTDGNLTNPEGEAPSGWVPGYTYGTTEISLSSVTVTLTPAQYGKRIILLTGTLAANVEVIFPYIQGDWTVINLTTGNYTVGCKTNGGTATIVDQGGKQRFYARDNNIYPLWLTETEGDSTRKLASTEFVMRAMANFALPTFQSLHASAGYQTLPNPNDAGKPLIIQWVTGAQDAANTFSRQRVTFPVTFPNSVFSYSLTMNVSGDSASWIDCWYRSYNLTTTGVNVLKDHEGAEPHTVTSRPFIMAIGD